MACTIGASSAPEAAAMRPEAAAAERQAESPFCVFLFVEVER